MSSKNLDLPVIDISQRGPETAKALLDAASTYGFVFVKNGEHGIPPSSIAQMFNKSQEFFSLPDDVKAECAINSKKSGKNRGWLSLRTETLDPGKQKRGDFKEAFNLSEFRDGQPQQPLPKPFADQQDSIGSFVESCHELCKAILRLFAEALEIPPSEGGDKWFSMRHEHSAGPSGSVLRLLYYPSLPGTDYDPKVDIRAGAHSDYGSVTLLFQLPGQPGLEILTPEGAWAAVPVDPSRSKTSEQDASSLPILVNIGDLLSYWTNGLLKSTVHRVIHPAESRQTGADRYSIAYFCHPTDSALLEPVPSPVVQTWAKTNGSLETADGTLTAQGHLESRLAATYHPSIPAV